MKYLSIIFTLVFCIVLASGSIAQTTWTKYSDNPVLIPGSAGDWDLGPIQHSSVVYDGSLYHMWYCGDGGAIGGCINHATSPDGITWMKDSLNNPVLIRGSLGSWDDDYVFSPSVIYDAVSFHMWYTGVHVAPPKEGIGYATSSDGVIWTKYDDPTTTSTLYAESDPVLIPGSAGSWDEAVVEAPTVIFESNSYIMWYRGRNNSSTQRGIGRAVSSDGISWTKEPENSPVLTPGPGWSWEESWMRLGSVVFDGTTYHLFYYAGAFYTNFRIGYARSSDGITWTKYDDPTTTNLPFSQSDPVLNWGSVGSWDEWQVLAPWVILDTLTSTYKMWYTGIDPDTNTGIGYATAPVVLNVPGSYSTIQAAIDAAGNGNIVLVDDGTYYENINFKGKAITVASRFLVDGDTSHIGNTIIDGSQPSHPDSASVVYFVSGEDTTSILCGFTITGGAGTSLPQDVVRAGGGILCYSSGGRITSNKIINNTLNDNSLFVAGGGFAGIPLGSNSYVILEKNKIIDNEVTCTGNFAFGAGVGVTCNGRLIDNEISYNTCTSTYSEANGGGVKITCESSFQPRFVTVKNNQITHNFAKGKKITGHHGAKGGGIVIHYCKVIIEENIISYNQLDAFANSDAYGAAISISGPLNESQISNNIISHNTIDENITSAGGGIRLRNSTIPITNNIISNNSAQNGGGIYLEYSSVVKMINNTIVKNTATSNGGGLYLTPSDYAVIVNSIFWDNQATSGSQIIGGGANVNYSDIQGGWTGPGIENIDSDPLFEDTLLFHLQDASLCIGAGIDSLQIGGNWYCCPNCDCEGCMRPNPPGTMPDIGAWESPRESPFGLEKPSSNDIPKTYDLKQNYPNPFNPSTTIEFELPKTSEVTLKIFNILGEEVATLVSDRLSAGSYSYEWDASELASGVYLYKLQAGDPSQSARQSYIETRKMMLIR